MMNHYHYNCYFNLFPNNIEHSDKTKSLMAETCLNRLPKHVYRGRWWKEKERNAKEKVRGRNRKKTQTATASTSARRRCEKTSKRRKEACPAPPPEDVVKIARRLTKQEAQ